MAYKYGDRNQIALLPPSIEEYVNEDAPVRAYDAIINALDFQDLGIELDDNKVGNSSYNPIAMLKLLAFGYSYGFRSSRKMERACYETLSFIWLMGGLKPDHKTICEFRRKNISALKVVLKQIVRLCIKLELVDGNVLFVDGSKFRGNSSKEKMRSGQWCEKKIAELDNRIDELLIKCEEEDKREAGENSYVKMKKELSQKEKLKKKIEYALSELENKNTKKVNITDPDSGIMKGRQGYHSGYNIQNVVDSKEGIIVHAEAVTEKNDLNQFSDQIKKGMQTTKRKCKAACADAGYSSTDDLDRINSERIDIVVPTPRQVQKKRSKPFEKSQFKYNKKENCYYCPEGCRLKYGGSEASKKTNYYKIEKIEDCQNCKNFGECTVSQKGRRVRRYWNEELKEKFEEQYRESQEIYRLRKQKVELPFGHIKYNMGYGQFLLRGLDKVQGEISLLSSCFNITRMISKLGVKGIIKTMVRIDTPQYA